MSEPDEAPYDDGKEGFSARFTKEEPLPCDRCWKRGFFHWPSLADHAPVEPERHSET